MMVNWKHKRLSWLSELLWLLKDCISAFYIAYAWGSFMQRYVNIQFENENKAFEIHAQLSRSNKKLLIKALKS